LSCAIAAFASNALASAVAPIALFNISLPPDSRFRVPARVFAALRRA
jgi:hypothetical protein